jgi:hypothetical protein
MSRFTACQSAINTTAVSISDFPPTVPYSELSLHLDNMNERSEPFPIWLNTIVLILFLIIFRLMGYLVLRYFRKPK